MSNIIVAYSSEEARRRVRLLLESGGWRCAACVSSGGEAIRAVRTLGDGRTIVICGARLGDMTASRLATSLGRGGSVAVIASAASLDLCEGENLYKLASPVSRSDFFALLDILARPPEKKGRPLSCRGKEEQSLIRWAKEILMDVNRMSESEAHRFLQKQSMDRGWKLTETARWVIESYTK